MLVQL